MLAAGRLLPHGLLLRLLYPLPPRLDRPLRLLRARRELDLDRRGREEGAVLRHRPVGVVEHALACAERQVLARASPLDELGRLVRLDRAVGLRLVAERRRIVLHGVDEQAHEVLDQQVDRLEERPQPGALGVKVGAVGIIVLWPMRVEKVDVRLRVVLLHRQEELARVRGADILNLDHRREGEHRRHPHERLEKVLKRQVAELDLLLVRVAADGADAAPQEDRLGLLRAELPALDEPHVVDEGHPLADRHQVVVSQRVVHLLRDLGVVLVEGL